MKKILSSIFLLFFTFACSKTEPLNTKTEWNINTNSGIINPSLWENQINISVTWTTLNENTSSWWETGTTLSTPNEPKTMSSKEYRDQLRAKIKSNLAQERQANSNASVSSSSTMTDTPTVTPTTVTQAPVVETPPPAVVETPPLVVETAPTPPPSTNTFAS